MKFFKKKLFIWADANKPEPTEYLELAKTLGWKPILTSNLELSDKLLGPNLNFILAINDPAEKAKLQAFLIASGQHPITLIHPSSSISPSTHVLEGVFIGANTTISSNSIIGNGVHISQNCSISNTCYIGDFSCLESSVDLQRGVQTGKECYFSSKSGANSEIILGCSIFIDPDIQLKEDIPSFSVVSTKNIGIISKLC